MNRSLFSRWFFAAGLLLTLIGFPLLVGGLFQQAGAAALPEDAASGYALWQRYRCESCHTLFGQGGAYAPDLTQIYELRGADYLREFIINPAAFHPDQRMMPRFNLTQTDTANLIALLRWTSQDAPEKDWSPQVLLVTGSGAERFSSTSQTVAADGPAARGRQIYGQRCASCHSLEPDIVIIGPSFYGIAERAATRVEGQSARDYLRTSILYPGDFLVEGFPDVMQKNFAEVMSSDDVDAVLDFMLTVGAGGEDN